MDEREDKFERDLDRAAKLILLNGPLTVYQTQKYLEEMRKRSGVIVQPNKKDPPLATVHGHFRILEEEGELTVYRRERTGRKQKFFGVTLYGFLWNLTPRIVETRFRKVLERWLTQEQFNFFLPKEEIMKAIEDDHVASSLGKFCLAISNGLPDTRDLLGFLRTLGYDESDPYVAQLLIQFALGKGASRNSSDVIDAIKVLCKTPSLPTFRKQMQQYVKAQRESLDIMEEEFGLVEGARTKS